MDRLLEDARVVRLFLVQIYLIELLALFENSRGRLHNSCVVCIHSINVYFSFSIFSLIIK